MCRSKDAPIIVILDWESKDYGKYESFARSLEGKLIIFKWKEETSNPNLTRSFKGTERFYSDRLVNIADSKNPGKIGKTSDGKYTINPADYSSIKKTLYDEIEANGINDQDIQYAKDFITEILKKFN